MRLINTQHNEVSKRLMKAVHWKQTRLKAKDFWRFFLHFDRTALGFSHLQKDKVPGYSNGPVALINIAINWSLDTTLQDSEVKVQRSGCCAREREERTKASCYKIHTSCRYAPLLHWRENGATLTTSRQTWRQIQWNTLSLPTLFWWFR